MFVADRNHKKRPFVQATIILVIQINGINHIAISVADLEMSIQWYHRNFGFTIIDRSEIPGAGVKVAHRQGVDFILEIFCAPDSKPLPDDRRVPNLDFLTQGNKHIAFGVKDGPKTKKEMEAMGIDMAFTAEVDGIYGVFIRDNTGNLTLGACPTSSFPQSDSVNGSF